MLNIFVGFEQTNRYAISALSQFSWSIPQETDNRVATEDGEPLGYIAEEPRGIFSVFFRQIFRTHRPFRALVMDNEGTPILWVGHLCSNAWHRANTVV